MRIAYLVQVHHQPEQFARLASRLAAPGSAVFCHVDRRVDDAPFREAVGGSGVKVSFIKERLNIAWGGFNSVLATGELLKAAFESGEYDFFVTMTGACYPLVGADEVHKFLDPGHTYMGIAPLGTKGHGKPRRWLTQLYFASSDRDSLVWGIANRYILPAISFRRINHVVPGGRGYGGSALWAVPTEAASWLLTALEDPAWVGIFRRSRNPDETFFHTVVATKPGNALVDRSSLTFADWSRPERGGSSPHVLVLDDMDLLRSCGRPFARKFDPEASETLLNWIDQETGHSGEGST